MVLLLQPVLAVLPLTVFLLQGLRQQKPQVQPQVQLLVQLLPGPDQQVFLLPFF